MNTKQIKVLTLTILTLAFLPQVSFGHTAELFEFDETAIDAEFNEVSIFEHAIDMNELSADEIYNRSQSLNLEISETYLSMSPTFGIADVDVESLACGFICWPIGLFTIDFDNTDAKISYLIGTVAAFIVWGGFGIAIL